ncbi:hypothetical protein BDN72DRAFT_80022 [Pluteus cervinus]|uniref:Uncharacterized protein n=1 Tax=Pluteus cervinus TaxID=181527 RepID=A0ACD3B9B2_9AGAR|nr:hypothetical protein BDN72DRAFT_80022 [Pluteus cervinus]
MYRVVREITDGKIASVSFLLWDVLITLDQEVEYIWSKPRNSWMKWQFFFTRYFAVAAQVTNRCIEGVIVSGVYLDTDPLKRWFISEIFVGNLLMTAVEVVLMVRVYALYGKNRWIGALFCLMLIAEAIAMVVGVVRNLPDGQFKEFNVLTTTPYSFIYYGIAACVTQIAILILTVIGYKLAVRDGWGKVPIVTLMLRDGSAIFLILFLVLIFTTVATMCGTSYAPIGYSWFLSIVASSGCRIILNMQQLPDPGPGSSIQLTTVIPDHERHHREA